MAKGKVPQKAIDPVLASLFSSSAGPVKAPSASRYTALPPPREKKPIENNEEDGDEEEDDEVLSELDDEELDDGDDDEDDKVEQAGAGSGSEEGAGDDSSSEKEQQETLEAKKKDRKRKRRDAYDDLESKYLRKLADDDEEEPTEKRQKAESKDQADGETDAAEDSDDDAIPLIHETLVKKTEQHVDVELDKANRTLFLGNISIEAITSSKAKKQLMAHLASPLAELDAASGPHKVETLRFRSTPFSAGALPKRAAYITKAVMSSTTKSTNAYVVYTTPLAARTAHKVLNGTVVLERHLRADSVAHPAVTDHRRCVFVGNLGFVDDETVLSTGADGETVSKKRNKVPSDIEEGLWRTFTQHAGRVETVRVPRDPVTRVGKGFAYVQFYDGNDVEAALLLEGKKYPPMLPRALRVSRAKDPRKTTLAAERSAKARLGDAYAMQGSAGHPKSTKYKHKATPEQQSLAGRAGRLLGRSGAAQKVRELKGGKAKKPRHRNGGEDRSGSNAMELGERGLKTPEQIVFEGRRASSKDGKPRDLKFNKGQGKKSAGRPKNRGAKRASEWRKKGSS